jgi:hypothetical protein
MDLLGSWKRRSNTHRLHQLASQIATASYEQVWQRTHLRAVSMRFPEAQGYVRARALAIVADRAAAALRSEGELSSDVRLTVLELAVQSVVDSVTHELLKAPMRYTSQRRAA